MKQCIICQKDAFFLCRFCGRAVCEEHKNEKIECPMKKEGIAIAVVSEDDKSPYCIFAALNED